MHKTSHPPHPSGNRRGVTLVEVMIAMFIFTLAAGGIVAVSLQSMRMAHQNVLLNTSYTVVQGYLEQIRSLSKTEFLEAFDDPGNVPLRTKSISALLSSTNSATDDNLFIGVTNHKEVMINADVSNTTVSEPVIMDLWITVTVNELSIPSGQAYEIRLDFDCEVRDRRGLPQVERQVMVRNGSGDYAMESRTLAGAGMNTRTIMSVRNTVEQE